VAADFLQGAHQVLMCLASEEIASAMIPTITHLLCSSPSPGIMGHHRACLQLSRRLSQRLSDRGVHTGADVILCLAALCDRHLDIDDVLNVMAKCGPVIVSLLHEVENPEVDLIRPALCIVALVWCAHGRESAQQMQNDDRFISVAEELVSAFIMSTRRLLKSTAACEKAVGILCTSFLTASFMDHISCHDFEWMAEESLVVCQQAVKTLPQNAHIHTYTHTQTYTHTHTHTCVASQYHCHLTCSGGRPCQYACCIISYHRCGC
jgi:hypothetical protein